MDQLIRENNIAEAMKIQYKADAIIYKMCEAKGNLYAVMKEILHRMYGLEAWKRQIAACTFSTGR